MTNAYKESGDLAELTPSELVVARCEAFRCGDFRFIYRSYHEDAPFLQAFPDCQAYLDYAEQALQGNFRIDACRIVGARTVADDEVQVLFLLQVSSQGQVQETVEVACIRCTAVGWRYHSGAKRPRSDFGCALEEISFDDFLDSDNLLFF